jgi:glutaredoxin
MRGLAYTEIDLGDQSLKEAFQNQFPHVTTVPFIIIDNVQIRGYEKLNEYFSNADRQFLTEG